MPETQTLPDLKDKFAALAEEWWMETGGLSILTQRIEHPAYKQILEMGDAIVPLLLSDLDDEEPVDWLHALETITGEDPVTPEMCGDLRLMAKAWIKWGKSKGYSW